MSWLPSTHSFSLDLPATYEALHLLEKSLHKFIEKHGLHLGSMFIHDILLATHEICTNIIDHAYSEPSSGRIQVKVSLCPSLSLLQIELRDNGRSFDPAAVLQPDLNTPQERGYGLFLVNQLMDAVNYIHHQDKNVWQLVKLYNQSLSN